MALAFLLVVFLVVVALIVLFVFPTHKIAELFTTQQPKKKPEKK